MDDLVLDEGEITLPMLVEVRRKGAPIGTLSPCWGSMTSVKSFAQKGWHSQNNAPRCGR